MSKVLEPVSAADNKRHELLAELALQLARRADAGKDIYDKAAIACTDLLTTYARLALRLGATPEQMRTIAAKLLDGIEPADPGERHPKVKA